MWEGTKMKLPNKYYYNRDKLRRDKIDKYGYWFCDKCKTNNDYLASMHHIVYRSEKPKHKCLHAKKNLIDLCAKCHVWFHEKKDRRNYLIEERKLTELFTNDIL